MRMRPHPPGFSFPAKVNPQFDQRKLALAPWALGHSLGARAAARALTAVGTVPDNTRRSRIVNAHLIGGAEGIGPVAKWTTIGGAVDEACYAYYSRNDIVLRYLYQVGTLLDSAAIGCEPIEVAPQIAAKIRSIDVTEHVSGHSAYKGALRQFIQ